MLQKAVISIIIIILIPVLCIVTEIILNRFFNCSSCENMYCIIPISSNTKDIEIKLISISNRMERICNENFTVFIADFGADDSTVRICQKYCNDNKCFVLINPNELSLILSSKL